MSPTSKSIISVIISMAIAQWIVLSVFVKRDRKGTVEMVLEAIERSKQPYEIFTNQPESPVQLPLPPGVILQSNAITKKVRWTSSDGRLTSDSFRTEQEASDSARWAVKWKEDQERENKGNWINLATNQPDAWPLDLPVSGK